MQCHVTRADGPLPHPSHFDEHERLKATRRECMSCHEVKGPNRGVAPRDSARAGLDGEASGD